MLDSHVQFWWFESIEWEISPVSCSRPPPLVHGGLKYAPFDLEQEMADG